MPKQYKRLDLGEAPDWYNELYSFLAKNGINVFNPLEARNLRIEKGEDKNAVYQYALLYTDENQKYFNPAPALNEKTDTPEAKNENALNAGLWYLNEHQNFLDSNDFFEQLNGQHLYKAFQDGKLVIIKDGKKYKISEDKGEFCLEEGQNLPEREANSDDTRVEENIDAFYENFGESYSNFLTQGQSLGEINGKESFYRFGNYTYPRDIKMKLVKETANSPAKTSKNLLADLHKHSMAFHSNKYYRGMMDAMDRLAELENKKELTSEDCAERFFLLNKLKDDAYAYMSRKVNNTLKYSDTANERMEMALRCYAYASTAERPMELKNPGMLMALPMPEDKLRAWYKDFLENLKEIGIDVKKPEGFVGLRCFNTVGIIPGPEGIAANMLALSFKNTDGTYRDRPPAKNDPDVADDEDIYNKKAFEWLKKQQKIIENPDINSLRKIYENFMAGKMVAADESNNQCTLILNSEGKVCFGKSLVDLAKQCTEFSVAPNEESLEAIYSTVKKDDPFINNPNKSEREVIWAKLDLAKQIGITKETKIEELQKNSEMYLKRLVDAIANKTKHFTGGSYQTAFNMINCSNLTMESQGGMKANDMQCYDDVSFALSDITVPFTSKHFEKMKQEVTSCLGMNGFEEKYLATYLAGQSMANAKADFLFYDLRKNSKKVRENPVFQQTVADIKDAYSKAKKVSEALEEAKKNPEKAKEAENMEKIPNMDKILKLDMKWAVEIFMDNMEKYAEKQNELLEAGMKPMMQNHPEQIAENKEQPKQEEQNPQVVEDQKKQDPVEEHKDQPEVSVNEKLM